MDQAIAKERTNTKNEAKRLRAITIAHFWSRGKIMKYFCHGKILITKILKGVMLGNLESVLEKVFAVFFHLLQQQKTFIKLYLESFGEC